MVLTKIATDNVYWDHFFVHARQWDRLECDYNDDTKCCLYVVFCCDDYFTRLRKHKILGFIPEDLLVIESKHLVSQIHDV